MPPINENVTVYGSLQDPTTDLSGFKVPSTITPIASALLSSINPLLGGAFSAISTAIANKKNYERQMDMYRENREYNSPAAQMQRFKDAGLNPNLIYGQSNTAQPVVVGNAVAPDFSFIGDAAQQGLDHYRTTETQNITNAIQLANYAISRVNLDYLPAEKRSLLIQLMRMTRKAFYDAETSSFNTLSSELEYKLKKLNYNYDYSQFEKGFAPDLDPKTRSIIGMLGQVLDYLDIIPFETFNRFIFQTQN